MNNLKCLKQGFNKYVCKHTNQVIELSKCKNCPYKEYKEQKSTVFSKNRDFSKKSPTISGLSKRKPDSMKKKTSKLSKLERNRFSIITNDMEHCILCTNKKDHIHELFFGRNRTNSMKYGTVVPLCSSCHARMHKDNKLQEVYHKIGQKCFNKHYPNLDFMEIFKINYL